MTTIPTLDVKSRPSPETDMRWVRWLGSMLDGSTSTGTITIKADRTSPLLDDDPDQPRSILPNPITSAVQEVNLVEDIGTRKYMYVAVPVPASDDPDLVGHGFTYTAEIKLKNGAQFGPYTFTVPLSTPATGLWLNKVAAATPAPGEALPQITKAEFDDAVARILVLESMGGAGGAPHAASHGPGGVDAVALSATQITTGVIAPARLGAGTADSSTVLFGDGSWKMVPGGSGSDPDAVKLTGDQTVSGVKSFTQAPSVPDGSWTVAKTTGLQALLDGKASSANPTFTGTVTGVTKAHVGLGNVDNTADSAKTFTGSQITSGTIPPARLGTGLAGASTVLYGDGTWKTAPTGGGGGTGEVPPGTPIVRFANPDRTWPTDLPTPTAAQPLILYADISSDPDMLAYPSPPAHVRNAYMRYHGPEWAELATVAATVTSKTGRKVVFDATPTLPSGVTAQGYEWSFSDGGTASVKSPTHTFAAAGAISASVTLTDSNGLTATSTVSDALTEGVPAVTLTGAPDGLTITWTATATDPEGDTLSYSWSGTASLSGSTASVTKTYTTDGVKTATVTVTDGHGSSVQQTATVTLVQSGADGVFTADTFTTATSGAANIVARTTENGSLGGTPTKPVRAGITPDSALSISGGRLQFTSPGAIVYFCPTAKPKVSVTIHSVHAGAGSQVTIMHDNAASNSERLVVNMFGDGSIGWEHTLNSMAANIAPAGTWATGDRITVTYQKATSVCTVSVSRGGTEVSSHPFTRAVNMGATQLVGIGSKSNSNTVLFDDLVVGETV